MSVARSHFVFSSRRCDAHYLSKVAAKVAIPSQYQEVSVSHHRVCTIDARADSSGISASQRFLALSMRGLCWCGSGSADISTGICQCVHHSAADPHAPDSGPSHVQYKALVAERLLADVIPVTVLFIEAVVTG